MFSNDYEDECATICKICTRHLNFGNLGAHLHQSHGIKMRDYQEKFGEPEITRKSYHECGICHETLLFIRYHLTMHVKNKHGLTIGEYNKKHMQLHNVEYNGTSLSFDKGRKIGTQKAPDWCDGTMYKCPYCFNVYYRYFTFRIHLINSHKVNDTEERSACVRENEILTDVYRCKVCRIQVKRDRMDIEAHLKQAHKTTLKLYTNNFERGQVFGEGPGCVSLAETIVRLVKEGQMEEPNEKMFKTPRKVQGSGKTSGRGSGGAKTRLPVPKLVAALPVKEERSMKEHGLKEEAFVEVKQELVEVKTEAFDPAGVSVGQAVGDGFVKCNQCDYMTSSVETLRIHMRSLHGGEIEAMGNTENSSPDQMKEPVLADFDLGKRKRKVPARFLSPSSPGTSGPPAKFKSPPSSSASLKASLPPGKSPTSKRKSPSSSKPSSPHSSSKAKHVRIASPKPVNSPSFIPTNNLQPPPNLLQKPPKDPESSSLNKMDPLKLLPRETLKVDSASINPTPPSLPLTPR